MTATIEQIAELKADLIAEWDRPLLAASGLDAFDLTFEGDESRPARGGFAVGHSFDEAGEMCLEIRLRAAGGSYHRRAEAIAGRARSRGVPTRLVVQPMPTIAWPQDAGLMHVPPTIEGRRIPLHIGASVSHVRAPGAGSLGAFVKTAAGDTAILSCSHVLARVRRGKARQGDVIRQPGPPDPHTGGNEIGHLTPHFGTLITGAHDNLDAAVATIAAGIDHIGNALPNLPCLPQALHGVSLGRPLARDELTTLTSVVKLGRTSGFTEGIVSALDIANLDVRFGHGGETYRFSKVHEVIVPGGRRCFTSPGDSGALVITRDGLRPVGLHFCAIMNADGSGVSYVVPWWRIADILKVRWL